MAVALGHTWVLGFPPSSSAIASQVLEEPQNHTAGVSQQHARLEVPQSYSSSVDEE